MSDYSQTTNFGAKDLLSSGDPLKLVKGTEIDTELSGISVAIATKTNQTRTLAAGDGLTGGGTLALDREFAVDIDGTAEQDAVDLANDYLLMYDNSATALRKIALEDAISSKAGASTSIIAGDALAGGGTLAADRTINVDIIGTTEQTGIDSPNDYMLMYDASATALRRVSITDIAATLSTVSVLVLAGDTKVAAVTEGAELRGSSSTANPPGGLDSADTLLTYLDASGAATVATAGFGGGSSFVLQNKMPDGQVILSGSRSDHTTRTLLSGSPGGSTSLYHDGTETVRSVAVADGGLKANNTETGTGWERVLTETDKMLTVAKTVDETYALDVLHNDAALVLPMEANSDYAVEMYIVWDGNAGFEWRVNGPAGGATSLIAEQRSEEDVASYTKTTLLPNIKNGTGYGALTWYNGTINAGEVQMVRITGIVRNGGTAGDLALQWGSGIAATLIVLEGSYFTLTKLG